jgi:exodeoxyribonuclease-5
MSLHRSELSNLSLTIGEQMRQVLFRRRNRDEIYSGTTAHFDTNIDGLSDEQKAVADAIEQWRRSDRQVFALHGAAGTGKSELLAYLARRYPDALLCAPTGKAAHVLRQRAGRDATTIHAAFHAFLQSKQSDNGRQVLTFEPRHANGSMRGKLLLLDEASMVSVKLAREILATGVRVIAACDPFQLPPVEGEQYFTEADATLREIHRQAWNSGIIRQAHAVRDGDSYQRDGDDFQVKFKPTEADYAQADVVLVHRNPTRRSVNAMLREDIHGISSPWPQRGEPVLCLKNAPWIGVFNGAVYEVISFAQDSAILDVEGRAVTIPNAQFIRHDEQVRGDAIAFELGYALTVHKAQGSEWDNVILIDEHPDRLDGRRQWLYTGITRAAKRLLVVRSP